MYTYISAGNILKYLSYVNGIFGTLFVLISEKYKNVISVISKFSNEKVRISVNLDVVIR